MGLPTVRREVLGTSFERVCGVQLTWNVQVL